MAFSIAAIADALGAEAEGDVSMRILRPAEPANAGPDDLALAMDRAFADGIALGQARAAILWPGADWRALGLKAAIFAPRSRYVMAGVTRVFEMPALIDAGIHPSALVHASARIGADVRIGAFVLIGRDVVISDGCKILSHCSIAEGHGGEEPAG